MTTRSLRTIAIVMAIAGAMASVGFTLFAGRHNSSRLLMALFAGWVALPFVCSVLVDRMAVDRAAAIRTALYWSTILLAVVSPAVYGRAALNPPRTRAAALFLVAPVASLLFVAVVTTIAALWTKRGADPTQ